MRWRGGGRSSTRSSLGNGANGRRENGFRKEEDEREGRLTNSNSTYKPFSPLEVAGNYKFAIESTHESTHEVQKIRKNMNKFQKNLNFGEKEFSSKMSF